MEYISTRCGLRLSSWNTLIQSASSHSDILRCISKLWSHLGAGLVNSFLLIFQPTHIIFSHACHVPWIGSSGYLTKSASRELVFCSFLHYHFTYSLFWPNIFFSTLKLSNIRESFKFSHKNRRNYTFQAPS
jgi:hypothetical protein